MGISADEAKSRVGALSDKEVHMIASKWTCFRGGG